MSKAKQQNQKPVALYWARHDLRMEDNPALQAASKLGIPVVALYVLDDETPGKWRVGAASRWWLHGSLRRFESGLRGLNIQLVLRSGAAREVVSNFAAECGAEQVFWNRRYAPAERRADELLKAQLKVGGFKVETFNSFLLAEPWEILTGAKTPFKVFSPFWRSLRPRLSGLKLTPAPTRCVEADRTYPGEDIELWRLTPSRPNWAEGFSGYWAPGYGGAGASLAVFCDSKLCHYAGGRDIPGSDLTSHLSPHLHFGEVGPRQAAAAVMASNDGVNAEKFLAELGWREFANHLLHHFPDFPEKNWRPDFDAFPWRDDEVQFQRWTRGQTGYPLVDAGMRELWASGYMHNRVRMVAASFLIKHLLIDWRRGQDWFWDTLVDADLANNSVSWQWVAGSGADAAPYFRIFNPSAQGERFDPDGEYVRRWIPELSRLPSKYIHAPWTAPDAVLRLAGVQLGSSYPSPIVDHKFARERALSAFKSISKSANVGDEV